MPRSRIIGATIALASGLLLVGCTNAPVPPPTSSAAPTSSVPTSAPASTTAAPPPTLHPNGSAAANQPFFDLTNRGVIARNGDAKGRDFIDALAAAGFDKQKMQVTSDTTTRGTPADAIQFSVELRGECLVGEYGPASGGYHSAVRPTLATGGCLLGRTRPIDW